MHIRHTHDSTELLEIGNPWSHSSFSHKLGLCGTGLGPNLAAGVTVANSIEVLGEYRSRWENFKDIDEHQATVRVPNSERKA